MKVSVKAQFLLDGHVGAESLTFLDETVRIAHFEDCALRAEGTGRVESIAIGERISTVKMSCLHHVHDNAMASKNQNLDVT